ncbi:hypothetical protein [Tessaracoccus antarcticus]|uniref:hypothetical protein n=1 Tax=Tessaracoccus antarcticus TaxID=2479848 RepID=UPI001F27F32B|nr:hypothetical protein [Tessaracoccus antarcticus]
MGVTQTLPRASGAQINLWLWIAFGVVVAMIIVVAAWLLFFRQTPTPTPTPIITQPADPTTEASTPGPIDEPTPDPTTPAPTTTPSTPSTSSNEPPVKAGTVIDAVAGCPATASDAIGVLGADGRFASGGGLSVAAAKGFAATPVQYPWIHQSNSQSKLYGANWMASITVGTVRAEDGFTETGATAVAMVGCMLGSDFYAGHATQAIVSESARAPEGDVVAMTANVAVTGVADIDSDYVYIMTILQGGVMHVLVSTVPASDDPGFTAVGDAVTDVRLA